MGGESGLTSLRAGASALAVAAVFLFSTTLPIVAVSAPVTVVVVQHSYTIPASPGGSSTITLNNVTAGDSILLEASFASKVSASVSDSFHSFWTGPGQGFFYPQPNVSAGIWWSRVPNFGTDVLTVKGENLTLLSVFELKNANISFGNLFTGGGWRSTPDSEGWGFIASGVTVPPGSFFAEITATRDVSLGETASCSFGTDQTPGLVLEDWCGSSSPFAPSTMTGAYGLFNTTDPINVDVQSSPVMVTGGANIGIFVEPGTLDPPNSTSSIPSAVTCPSAVQVGRLFTCKFAIPLNAPGLVTWNADGYTTTCHISKMTCKGVVRATIAGTHVVNAFYASDDHSQNSSSSSSVTILKAKPGLTVKCSSTTCTVRVSGYSPSGVVSWSDGNSCVLSPVTLGKSTCLVNRPLGGTYALAYSGDTSNIPKTITKTLK